MGKVLYPGENSDFDSNSDAKDFIHEGKTDGQGHQDVTACTDESLPSGPRSLP